MGWKNVTFAQYETIRLVMNNWFPADAGNISNIQTAAAIAFAESGNNPKAISPTGDYGLWQINKAAHPDLFAKYKWDDPADNVKMAAAVYHAAGNKFTPWTAYKNGAYKAHIPQYEGDASTLDVIKGVGPILGQEAASALPGVGAVTGVLGDLNPANWLDWAKNAFLTAGVFILALVLLIVGVWLLLPREIRPKAVPIPV